MDKASASDKPSVITRGIEGVAALSYPQKSKAIEYHQQEKGLHVGSFTNKQRKQLQHEFKLHMEKYAKGLIGKGSDHTKVVIWDDMMILRCEGFLTEPERFIATTVSGVNLVKESRMEIAKQFATDKVPYIEEFLGASCIHQTFDVEADKDFWIHVMVFDKLLIETK
ncbi:DUF2294 domain-containing protein [Neobacillus niacini]|uniref:DUF2294 domain-containing protein n=1 Tax=Neobacillus niacini TaxID=86668 RepID=UPI002FFE0FC8